MCSWFSSKRILQNENLEEMFTAMLEHHTIFNIQYERSYQYTIYIKYRLINSFMEKLEDMFHGYLLLIIFIVD